MKPIKYLFLMLALATLANCAPGDLESQAQQEANANLGLGVPEVDNALPPVLEPIPMEEEDDVVVDAEDNDVQDVADNNVPAQPQVQLPQLPDLINQVKEPSSGGGFLNGLLGTVGSIFGGGSGGTAGNIISGISNIFSGGNSGGSNKCSILNSIVGIGGSLLSGGNPLVGGLLGRLPGLLFNCGGQSKLSNLIPNGASDQERIFEFLGHVLQQTNQGQDAFDFITLVKNPKDVTAMVDILKQLAGQSGDPQLEELLDNFMLFQSVMDPS